MTTANRLANIRTDWDDQADLDGRPTDDLLALRDFWRTYAGKLRGCTRADLAMIEKALARRGWTEPAQA